MSVVPKKRGSSKVVNSCATSRPTPAWLGDVERYAAVAAAAALGRRPRRLRRRASPPSWLVGALRRLHALALAPSLASGFSSGERAAVSTRDSEQLERSEQSPEQSPAPSCPQCGSKDISAEKGVDMLCNVCGYYCGLESDDEFEMQHELEREIEADLEADFEAEALLEAEGY